MLILHSDYIDGSGYFSLSVYMWGIPLAYIRRRFSLRLCFHVFWEARRDRFKVPHPRTRDLSWCALCWWSPQKSHKNWEVAKQSFTFQECRRGHPAVQEVIRVSHWVIDLQPRKQTQWQRQSLLQKAKRIYTPRQVLASVTSVVTWAQVQWVSEEEASQHGRLWRWRWGEN